MTLVVGTSQGKPLLSSLIPPLSSRFSLSVLYLSFSLSLCLSVCHVESDLVFDSGLSVTFEKKKKIEWKDPTRFKNTTILSSFQYNKNVPRRYYTVNVNVAQSCLSGSTPQARFGRDWPRLTNSRSDYHSNQAANVDLPVVWIAYYSSASWHTHRRGHSHDGQIFDGHGHIHDNRSQSWLVGFTRKRITIVLVCWLA